VGFLFTRYSGGLTEMLIMKLRVWRLFPVLLPFVIGACGTSLTQPTSSVVSGATTSGVTATSASTPALLTPADGAKMAFAAQPFTLTVANAVSTASTTPTYTFEVATDAGFANIVSKKTGVTPGAGQTSTVIDPLPALVTFFWRARVVGGSDQGPNPKPRSFTVGAQVLLQAPVPVSPGQNAQVSGSAALTVTNSQRSGPAGPITYLFQVSNSNSFSPLVFSANVPENPGGQTSAVVNAQLSGGTTYYWRAQAMDATNGVTTAFTSSLAFSYTAFDMRQATIWNNPPDLGSWAATANMTMIQFGNGVFSFDFDKRTGPNRWPDVPYGPGGSLQFTLGMCLNINGHWNCSAPIQYWYGRDTVASASIQQDWFYDARWGAMQGHQPAYGEQVGFFVAAGNLRNVTDDSGSYVFERSNVLFLPWGQNYP
jgi:hypothetical protein